MRRLFFGTMIIAFIGLIGCEGEPEPVPPEQQQEMQKSHEAFLQHSSKPPEGIKKKR